MLSIYTRYIIYSKEGQEQNPCPVNTPSGKSGQVKQRAQGTEASMGWGIWHILSIKEHLLVFNMDNTIFSLTVGAHATVGGGAQTGAGG